jgi:hypothetical protein
MEEQKEAIEQNGPRRLVCFDFPLIYEGAAPNKERAAQNMPAIGRSLATELLARELLARCVHELALLVGHLGVMQIE